MTTKRCSEPTCFAHKGETCARGEHNPNDCEMMNPAAQRHERVTEEELLRALRAPVDVEEEMAWIEEALRTSSGKIGLAKDIARLIRPHVKERARAVQEAAELRRSLGEYAAQNSALRAEISHLKSSVATPATEGTPPDPG